MDVKALLLGESVRMDIPESTRNSERHISQGVCLSKSYDVCGAFVAQDSNAWGFHSTWNLEVRPDRR